MVAQPLTKENSTINELEMPNFRLLFSLNDFWVLQGGRLPLTKKKMHLVISKRLIYSGPISV